LPADFSPDARIKQPSIFLSWGGEIYGPATEGEVVRGVQTSWFEESALYWHEGLDSWRPVYEFKPSSKWRSEPDWNSRKVGFAPRAPRLPEQRKRAQRGSRGQRERKPKAAMRRGIGRSGRAIVFGFAALAVALTVAILLLLMLI